MTVNGCPRPFHGPPRLRLFGVAGDDLENLETKAIEMFRRHAAEERDHVFDARLGR